MDTEAMRTPTHLPDRVYAVADRHALLAVDDPVLRSWQRCANDYGLDPNSPEPARILTSSELREFRDPLAKLIVIARDELNRLYTIAKQAGYVVLLCDHKGVAIDHRGNAADAEHFEHWGIWLGGLWSEDVEGTNGIGTCIAEERPVTVHRAQHFRARYASLSCAGAPIFDGGGRLLAVLDVSCSDPSLSQASHALTGALTQSFARAIEERYFRDYFRRAWVLAAAGSGGTGSSMLFALDQDQRIVGADRNARGMLARADGGIEQDLWAVFERNPAPFRHKDRGDVSTQLVPAVSGEPWSALITPPGNASGRWRSLEDADLHSRPRLTADRNKPVLSLARGGLRPQALRRVREYVDAHLQESISLRELAAVSTLSMYHFSRAFKQSQGLTPHAYLLQRRIERAEELLVETDLPISEITFATGFSSQSHFARRFRELVGEAPSAFRWSKR